VFLLTQIKHLRLNIYQLCFNWLPCSGRRVIGNVVITQEIILANLLYQCLTKATDKESGNPKHSHNWIFSKRATFKIFDDHIECGSWTFSLNDISNCILFKSKHLFFTATVLQFESNGKTFQFGFNPWAKPEQYLKLNYKEEQVKFGFSTFSIVIRILAVVYLLFYIWKKFF
jgi:hypothetical protein